jgi:hypothetical protein
MCNWLLSRFFPVLPEKIEENRTVVGWLPGHDWLGLRPWIYGHQSVAAITIWLLCMVLGRVLLASAGRLWAFCHAAPGATTTTSEKTK